VRKKPRCDQRKKPRGFCGALDAFARSLFRGTDCPQLIATSNELSSEQQSARLIESDLVVAAVTELWVGCAFELHGFPDAPLRERGAGGRPGGGWDDVSRVVDVAITSSQTGGFSQLKYKRRP
jgi:hypothetical protein